MGTVGYNFNLTVICILKTYFLFVNFAKFNDERLKLDFWYGLNNDFDNICNLSKLLAEESNLNFFFFRNRRIIRDVYGWIFFCNSCSFRYFKVFILTFCLIVALRQCDRASYLFPFYCTQLYLTLNYVLHINAYQICHQCVFTFNY